MTVSAISSLKTALLANYIPKMSINQEKLILDKKDKKTMDLHKVQYKLHN